MKKLMTGNEAVARGAYEAGCVFAAAYPGTPSTEILENMPQYKEVYCEWSTNEKVALEAACGAAIAGGRSLAAMKHVGLNVAADPMFTIAYEGVNGGLVIVSADDPGCHSSQNEQDNRNYGPFARVAVVEPADSQECKDFMGVAFQLSEEFDTPVIFRMTTRVCHSKSPVDLGKRQQAGIREYTKDVTKFVMSPALARQRHIVVEEKLRRFRDYAEKSPLNRIEWGEKKLGIITSGISYQHAREVFGKEASYLKIGLAYPLPEQLIRDFAGSVEMVYIIEENDPYLEKHVKSLGLDCLGKEVIPICGELSPAVLRKTQPAKEEATLGYESRLIAPSRPPILCAGCPHRGPFYALSKYKDVIVAGDIGCYTLGMVPPLSVTDTVICMGAGISAAIGMEKVAARADRKVKVFGIVGDSTFFHSGITGLIDAVYNRSNIAVIIMDNRTTAMTGHQENPGTGKTLMGQLAPALNIENIVRAVGVKEENLKIVDPYDLAETEQAIRKAYQAKELFVIITRQPCALLKEVQKNRENQRCVIDDKKCKKCKVCLKIGCPAIAFKGERIIIDASSCNGCSLCLQVCKFAAIKKEAE